MSADAVVDVTAAVARMTGRRALTARECQILDLVADGRSNYGIGSRLGLSEDTVKTHLQRIYRVLGARDRAHAVHLRHVHGDGPVLAPPVVPSRSRLHETIARWQGRVPLALLEELRAIADGGPR